MLTKEEAARSLIDWHFRTGPALVGAYRFLASNEEDPKEPIKLLEVDDSTAATGEVMTFTFGGTNEIPYPLRIATVTSDEMDKIRQGEIALPTGWDLSRSVAYDAPNRLRYWRKAMRGGKRIGASPRRLRTY